ncbi:thioredoxin fold domain-containing protein [Chryseobacterium sp. ISL-6]|uniref:thioredoxin family protein n=1 Tax=Chryseobacterium sp. ISL-6 TaxID=2819143 RepID=UPI001BE9E8DD|nr:thioredoxin fold domain-containing protein [Chryseobacterium sp. ISL-6]MBT2620581.1 thioredoxin fold domain-containing protein [Chryseobacterium sp. ISL-6]
MIKVILFVVCTSGIFLSAQGVKFENNKFSEILAKAKKENKLIFLDTYTSWCAPCKLMGKKVFPLQSVSEYYNSNFIDAQFDMEKGEGLAIAKKYKVSSYPTYLFINGDGEEVHRGKGFMEENEFIQLGKNAQDPSKQISVLKKNFDNGEKNPESLKKLARLTSDDAEFNYKVVKRYFELKPDISNEDVMLLFTSVNGYEDPRYELIQAKKAEIVKLISQENFDEYNQLIILKGIRKKAYDKSTKQLNDNIFLQEGEKFFGKEKTQELFLDEKANAALENKDYTTYEKMMLEKYQSDYTKEDPMELAMIAGNFADHIETKSSLETAARWASEAENKNSNPMIEYTLAKLYYKMGDKSKAKGYSEKSLEGACKLQVRDPDFEAELKKFIDHLNS